MFGFFRQQAAVVLDFPAQKAAYGQRRGEHIGSEGEDADGAVFIKHADPICGTAAVVLECPIHTQYQNIDEKISQNQTQKLSFHGSSCLSGGYQEKASW